MLAFRLSSRSVLARERTRAIGPFEWSSKKMPLNTHLKKARPEGQNRREFLAAQENSAKTAFFSA